MTLSIKKTLLILLIFGFFVFPLVSEASIFNDDSSSLFSDNEVGSLFSFISKGEGNLFFSSSGSLLSKFLSKFNATILAQNCVKIDVTCDGDWLFEHYENCNGERVTNCSSKDKQCQGGECVAKPSPRKCDNNGTCKPGVEDYLTCPDDCPKPRSVSCGDGRCSSGVENKNNCSEDCGSTTTKCGDGRCKPGVEDYMTCSDDCPLSSPLSNGRPCVEAKHCKSGVCEGKRCVSASASPPVTPPSGSCTEEKIAECIAQGESCRDGECVLVAVSPSRVCDEDRIAECVSQEKLCQDGECVEVTTDSDLPNGTPCLLSSRCKSGFCNTETYVCSGSYPNGRGCLTDPQCQSNFCNTITHVCTDKLPNGVTCVKGSRCESGFCDPFLHVCTSEKRPNGALCALNRQCESEFCDPILHICTPLERPNGVPCVLNRQCKSDFCDPVFHICAGELPNGVPCLTNKQCESGFCSMILHICTGGLPNNVPCVSDSECKSGNCDYPSWWFLWRPAVCKD